MPGLSAKVFRTYNASMTLQQELSKIDINQTDLSAPSSIAGFYDSANRAVAILCNHQRSVPKQHAASMEKMALQMEEIDAGIAECQMYLDCLRSGKKSPKLKKENSDCDEKPRKTVLKPGTSEQNVSKKLEQFKAKKVKLVHKSKLKDENKEVALSTSKINYMDPRISVAFFKKYELPVEKVFGKGLRDKFPWAMYAKTDFCF